MDSAAEVLLIIVSVTLSVFLIVLVVALLYVISVMRQLKRISAQAENVVDSVQAAASAFERKVSPLRVLRLINNIVGHTSSGRRKKG
jgi:predicted PurR-regulated permease PerM